MLLLMMIVSASAGDSEVTVFGPDRIIIAHCVRR